MSVDSIRARHAAATKGPWELKGCAPCAERGRQEFTIWADNGNTPIAGWCDEDPYTPEDAEFIANAPTDMAALLDALDAVTRLHRPDSSAMIGPYCSHCTSPIDGGPELYPCATIRAIQSATGGEQ